MLNTYLGSGKNIHIINADNFVLYIVNGCAMKGIVEERLRDKDKKSSYEDNDLNLIPSIKNVEFVEIDNNGCVTTINNEIGSVGENWFNGLMNTIMENYYELLTYHNKDENHK